MAVVEWSEAGLLEALSVEVGEVEDDEEDEEEEGEGDEGGVREEGERVGESGVFSQKDSVFLRRPLVVAGGGAGAGGLEDEANMCRERDVSWSFISLSLCLCRRLLSASSSRCVFDEVCCLLLETVVAHATRQNEKWESKNGQKQDS